MPEEGSTEIQRVTGTFSPKSFSGVSGQEGSFTAEIADLPLRQDLLAKNVLMTAQRNFCLGNNPLRTKGLHSC
jgi:hypothetical protein